MWQNGKQHGEGKYFHVDGTVKCGIWKNGKRIRWLDESEASGNPQQNPDEDDTDN